MEISLEEKLFQAIIVEDQELVSQNLSKGMISITVFE